jgi:Holliday junction DNA helicase RuvA
MYAYLRGIYKGRAPLADETVLLEVDGVGYEVFVPPIVEQQLAATCHEDDPLLLYVSAQSGRDQPWPVLFGFLRPEEKAFWELLISVPRIGGKLAARAMAVPIESIAEAIKDGNRVFLDTLPGITLDGADKIIASLRKKVGPFVQPMPERAPTARRTEEDDVRDGAVQLLVNMGLKRPDAQRGVDRLLETRDDITSIQDIIVEFFRAQPA